MNSVFDGDLPKIGIRPTIDGRAGVRETLEAQTMGMANAVAELIGKTLRHPNGKAVECVIADRTISGFAEAAACADKFAHLNVGATITVTPCWCYGSETMDLAPQLPKAVWGFNGTERPGAVYLAAVLAAHNQKGLPAFGIYGRDVQDQADRSIPADVEAKILRFTRAALAVAHMRGKAYLSIGGVSMGIAGSIVDQAFFQKYLGIRPECIDMSEVQRRLQLGIFDHDEFSKAFNWVEAHCTEGADINPPEKQHSPELKKREWEQSVQMAMIGRDLMVGNPKLAEMGLHEESNGHHAILAGFQGQRQWTDFMPNGDFLETMLNTSFDWNGPRAPFVLATENDCLNGVGMLFNYLLTQRAQIFSDVRTFWSPEAIARVSGWQPEGAAANGVIHLINSGATCLDATGEMMVEGAPAIKPFWDVT
ncbi:MAG: L-fucose isomerase, partial [Rhizomicrobium sp.]